MKYGSPDELIQEVTSQNAELFSMILEPSRRRTSSVMLYKTIKKRARRMHENTGDIDTELRLLLHELQKEPQTTVETHEVKEEDKLQLENYQLKQKLLKTEAEFMLFYKTKKESVEVDICKIKIKEMNIELQRLTEQNRRLTETVRSLKYTKKRLLRTIAGQESIKDRLKTLNGSYAAQEKLVAELQKSLGRSQSKGKIVKK